MVNDSNEIFLDSGFLDVTMPLKFWHKFIWILGIILVIIGLILHASIYYLIYEEQASFTIDSLIMPILILILGSTLILYVAPTQLKRKLQEIRQNTKPRDYLIRSEAGSELTDFWKQEWIHKPTSDDRGWVFKSPGEKYWDKKRKYDPDDTGTILEHPNLIGTPKPAEISTYGIISIMILVNLFPIIYLIISEGLSLEYIEWKLTEGSDDNIYKFYLIKYFSIFTPLILSLIWFFYSIVLSRRISDTIETPTSYIRSMTAGNIELVGQVRYWQSKPPTVYVGRDYSRAVDNLTSWNWNYEILVETTHVVTDKNGNIKTEKRQTWHTVESDSGNYSYVLHDGTGGVLVHPGTFKLQNLGQYIARWECPHNVFDYDLYQGTFHRTWNEGRILRHKWTLFGLAIGDPCYLIGYAKPRDPKNRDIKEQIEMSESEILNNEHVQNRLLEVIGEDGATNEARLERGSELAALANSRSNIEYLLIPGLNLTFILTITFYSFLLSSF